MKTFKKIVTLALAAIMTLGMSLTAFAAESNTITVKAPEGAKVSYVKVLEANTKTTTGYSFVDDYASSFDEAFETEGQATIEALIALVDKNADYTNVSAINSSSTLATALDGVSGDFTVAGTVAKDATSVEISDVTTGLYVIKAELDGYSFIPMLAFVDNAGTNVTVVAKGDKVTVDKAVADDGQSVAPGDVVDYTITVEYPYFAPNTQDQVFTITDTLTNATFVQNSVKFTGVEGTPSFNDANDTMTVSFGDYDSSLAGTTITITYSVTANADVASTKNLTNKVDAKFGTDTDSWTVQSGTADISITKVDESGATLTDTAEFTLYVADENGTVSLSNYVDENKNAVEGTYSVWQVKNTVDGIATFTGLDSDKTYYIVETAAPTGYSVDGIAHAVTVETDEGTPIYAEDNTTVIGVKYTTTASISNNNKIADSALSSLPFTGGMGTTIFTIAGVVIMVLAAALYFATKRKAAN